MLLNVAVLDEEGLKTLLIADGTATNMTVNESEQSEAKTLDIKTNEQKKLF